MINKNMEIQEYKSIDDEIIEILASDESVDRDNDIIKAKGWRTDNWVNNGALLYGHDPSSPFNVLGSPVSADVRGSKLYIRARLAKEGTSPTHDAIRSLIQQKILKGVSVGFKADDYEPNEFGGRTFKSQELLELSIVPVPANANARMLLKSYGKEVQDALISKEEYVSEKRVKEIIEEYIKQLSDTKPQDNKDETLQEEAKDAKPEHKSFIDVINKKLRGE